MEDDAAGVIFCRALLDERAVIGVVTRVRARGSLRTSTRIEIGA